MLKRTCAKLAELAGVQATEVLPFSTGVIGEQLPIEAFGKWFTACIK